MVLGFKVKDAGGLKPVRQADAERLPEAPGLRRFPTSVAGVDPLLFFAVLGTRGVGRG